MERLAGRIILFWGWRRALTSFLAGALLVLAQAPYDFFAVGFISFPVLVWLLDGATVAQPAGFLRRLVPAFATGYWFGFGYFLFGLWWIGNALLFEAESFAWALPFAVLGVPMVLALFYALAVVVARLFWSDNIGRIAALAFGFGLAEWLRSIVLTGFPWNAIGYAAMPVPLLMQSVSIVGMTGMNALAVLVFALPGLLASRRDRRTGIAFAFLLCAAHAGFGYYRLDRPIENDGRSIAVRIVQPAVGMTQKFDKAEEDRVFANLVDESAKPAADGKPAPQLILWPETSVPFLFSDRPEALALLGSKLSEGQLLVAGAIRSEEGTGNETKYYNSVVAIDAEGQIVDAVDKVHLVPFGEYLPFEEMLAEIGVDQLVAGPMNFNAGAARHGLTLSNGIKAVPFICYEIIFPDLVARDATGTDLIINVTNDAWFGHTPGPYQHFRMAQIRAVELGMPVLRAANTGVSGIIDIRGRVVDALALDSRGAIDATLNLSKPAAPLPIPVWQVGFGILLLLAFVAILMRVRQRITSRWRA